MSSFFKKLSASVAQAVASVNEVASSLSLDNLQDEYGDRSGRHSIFQSLDLTYLTPRLLIMGYPSTPTTRLRSRNDAASVALFLQDFHPGGAMVWDLSDEAAGYDSAIFNNQVIRVNFPGQPMPQLGLLVKICSSIERWLAADPGNVAVLHCSSGRGRTCAVAACVLAWTREFASCASALAYVCERRQQTLDRLRAAASAPGQGLLSTGLPGVDGALLAAASNADSLIAASTLALPPGQLLPPAEGGSSAAPSAAATKAAKSGASNGWGGVTDPVVAICCPSQRRYVAYWDRLLSSKGACLTSSRSASRKLLLKRLIVNGVPAVLVPAAAAAKPVDAAAAETTAAAAEATAAMQPPAGDSPGTAASSSSEAQDKAAQVAAQVAQATRALASAVSSAVAATIEDLRSSEVVTSSSGSSSTGVQAAAITPAVAVYVAGACVAEGGPGAGDASGALEAGEAGAFKAELSAEVEGDVLLRLLHRRRGGAAGLSVWTAALHTAFLDTGADEAAPGFVLRLPRSQLDVAPRVMVGAPEALLHQKRASGAASADSGSAAAESGDASSGGAALVALPEHAFVEAVFEVQAAPTDGEDSSSNSSSAVSALAADVAGWASRGQGADDAPDAAACGGGEGLSTPRSGTGPASIPELLAAAKAKQVAAKKSTPAAAATAVPASGGGLSSLFGGWGASAAATPASVPASGTGGAAAVMAALAVPLGGEEHDAHDPYLLQLHADDAAPHFGLSAASVGGRKGVTPDLAAADAASLDILAELEQELAGSTPLVTGASPASKSGSASKAEAALAPAAPPAPAVVLTAGSKAASKSATGADDDIDDIEQYLNSL